MRRKEEQSSFGTVGSCGVQFLAACEVLLKDATRFPVSKSVILSHFRRPQQERSQRLRDVYGLSVCVQGANNLADIGLGRRPVLGLDRRSFVPISAENEFESKLALSSCNIQCRRRRGRAPSHRLGGICGDQIGAENVREKQGEESGCSRKGGWQRAQ
jgi:hypothetical protein